MVGAGDLNGVKKNITTTLMLSFYLLTLASVPKTIKMMLKIL
jgi:hypothetical protein